MEATENCTKAINATQEARLKTNSVIDAVYEGCVRNFVMPHVKHVYVLLPLPRFHVRHARLDLYIMVSLKGRTNSHLVLWLWFHLYYCNGMCWVQTIIWYNYSFIIIDYY